MGLVRHTPAQLLLTYSYTLRPDIQTSVVSFDHATILSPTRVSLESLPEHSSTGIGMVSDVDSYSSEAARIGLLHFGTDRSRAR